jgi:hypothetical protein
MDEVPFESHIPATIHGACAGQKAKVEQSEDQDGAKTSLTFGDILPSQILPVLFDS